MNAYKFNRSTFEITKMEVIRISLKVVTLPKEPGGREKWMYRSAADHEIFVSEQEATDFKIEFLGEWVTNCRNEADRLEAVIEELRNA